MKKWWNKLERLLDGVSYRKKIACNLTLCAVMALLIWTQFGCPLPTAELEFRRMERTHLLPRSEIVFATGERSRDLMSVSGQDQSVYALDGTEFYLRRGPWIAGLGEEHAILAYTDRESWKRDLSVVPLDREGATMLAFPAGYGYWVTQGPGETPEGDPAYVYNYHNFFPLLVVDVPAETARAEITVSKDGMSVTGPGWNMGKHVWLMTPDNQVLPYQTSSEETYTLRLYREDGSLLLEKSGILGEG